MTIFWKEGVGVVAGAPVACTYVFYKRRGYKHREMPCAEAETLNGFRSQVDYHVPVRLRLPQGRVVEHVVRIAGRPRPGQQVEVLYARDGSGLAAPSSWTMDSNWHLHLAIALVSLFVAGWPLIERLVHKILSSDPSPSGNSPPPLSPPEEPSPRPSFGRRRRP